MEDVCLALTGGLVKIAILNVFTAFLVIKNQEPVHPVSQISGVHSVRMNANIVVTYVT